MSENMNDKVESVQTAFWAGKLGLALIWTITCAGFWILFLVAMVNQPPPPNTTPDMANTALGMAGCMATGCVGSVWLVGLIVLLVLYAIIRR